MGTLKKYTANTQVSVNIVLPNGKSTRISFSGNTLGKSAYYTSDPDIQGGLENHYRYGTLFKADEDFEKTKPSKKTKKKSEVIEKKDMETPEADPTEPKIDEPEAEESEDPSEPQELIFSDLGSAKEYICTTYGIARTKLKTQENIENAAASYGIHLRIE